MIAWYVFLFRRSSADKAERVVSTLYCPSLSRYVLQSSSSAGSSSTHRILIRFSCLVFTGWQSCVTINYTPVTSIIVELRELLLISFLRRDHQLWVSPSSADLAGQTLYNHYQQIIYCSIHKLHEYQLWMKDAAMVNGEISGLAKCTKRYVLIVEKSVRFHSNPQREDRFTARIVSQNTENQDSDLNRKLELYHSLFQWMKFTVLTACNCGYRSWSHQTDLLNDRVRLWHPDCFFTRWGWSDVFCYNLYQLRTIEKRVAWERELSGKYRKTQQNWRINSGVLCEGVIIGVVS